MFFKRLTRRDFIGKTTAGITGAVVSSGVMSFAAGSCKKDSYRAGDYSKDSTHAFARLSSTYPLKTFMNITKSFQSNRCIYIEEILLPDPLMMKCLFPIRAGV